MVASFSLRATLTGREPCNMNNKSTKQDMGYAPNREVIAQRVKMEGKRPIPIGGFQKSIYALCQALTLCANLLRSVLYFYA